MTGWGDGADYPHPDRNRRGNYSVSTFADTTKFTPFCSDSGTERLIFKISRQGGSAA
jgi:hypothetical protein